MAKTTLSVPDTLKDKMDAYPSIKWSEILRTMIIRKIEEVKKVDELKRKGVL